MLKKISVFFIFLIIIILLGFTYSIFTKSYVTLTENKTISKSLDDFILHVRVNDNKDGVEVMHSIQYTGEDSVEIQHQTPLVSVSMVNAKHDFTGSYVTKPMEEGDIYHSPQKADILSSLNKNECNLYVKAKFQVEGEKKVIEHVEELTFK